MEDLTTTTTTTTTHGDSARLLMERWAAALEAASPEGQSVALRLSAARSVQHSRLLSADSCSVVAAVGASAASDVSAGVAAMDIVQLRASLCALALLQDDDEDVRDVVNELLIGACSRVQNNALLAVKVPAGYATTEVKRTTIMNHHNNTKIVLIFCLIVGVLHASSDFDHCASIGAARIQHSRF